MGKSHEVLHFDGIIYNFKLKFWIKKCLTDGQTIELQKKKTLLKQYLN